MIEHRGTRLIFSVAIVVFILVAVGYSVGYGLGANMATNKGEEAIAEMGVVFAVQLSEIVEANNACANALKDSSLLVEDYAGIVDEQMIPMVDDLLRLSHDLTFDLSQCRGGDDIMLQACTLDYNCSGCLQQFADDEGGGMYGPTEKEFCIRNALLDKNEWYDLMGLPYYDGCTWDNCACADDEFIESSPDACSPELLAYYKKD